MFSSLDFTAKSSFFFPKVSWLSSLKETRRIEIERLQTQGQAPGFRGKICGIFWCQQKNNRGEESQAKICWFDILLKKGTTTICLIFKGGPWCLKCDLWFFDREVPCHFPSVEKIWEADISMMDFLTKFLQKKRTSCFVFVMDVLPISGLPDWQHIGM